MWSERGVDEDICTSLFRSYALENSISYPMLIGEDMDVTTKIQLTIFLVSIIKFLSLLSPLVLKSFTAYLQDVVRVTCPLIIVCGENF